MSKVARRPQAWRGTVLALAALMALVAVAAGCASLPPFLGGPKKPKVEFVPYPEAEVSTWQNPHDYQGKPLCQRCHELQGGALRGHPIGLCVSCHTFGHGNHPVNVAQKPPLPKDLPFLEGGKLACHTCHDPHDLKAHQAGLRAEFNDLCLRCHVKH